MAERKISSRIAPWVMAAGLGLPASAMAAGFAITEENATGLGTAYSDMATGNGNASGTYFNPAAMSDLGGTQFSAGLIYIDPTFRLHDGKSTTPLNTTVNGGDGGNAGVPALVPDLYITHQVDPRLHVGLGISVPYGLSTAYDSGWLGRYHALKSDVQVINFNPAFSFDADPKLSLGLGLDIQYANAELTSAVDSSTLCIAGGGSASYCNTLQDGTARVKGHDWAVGWNTGLLWRMTPKTQVGFTYRSAVDHKLKGSVAYTNIPSALASNAQLADSNATAALNLPATANLGVSHELSKRWTLTADMLWTQWSRFKELRVVKDNGQPDLVTTENWKDTMRYAVGASFKQSDKLTWRAGLAYDPTPVPDAQHRTARLPDSDRTWLSLGMGYHVNSQTTVDVGYTHIWLKKVSTDNTTEGSYKNTLTGSYTGSVDILGAQFSYRF